MHWVTRNSRRRTGCCATLGMIGLEHGDRVQYHLPVGLIGLIRQDNGVRPIGVQSSFEEEKRIALLPGRASIILGLIPIECLHTVQLE